MVAAGELGAPVGPALMSTAREAFVQGLHLIAVIAAVALVGTAALVFSMLRGVDLESAVPTDQGDGIAGDDPEASEPALAA
jgi:DHA2 family multidrug resistance protein-like MFS transporter